MTKPTDELSLFIAGELLRIGAVTLSTDEPYTWASGLRSPVYCDNRLILGYPEIRRRVRDGFAGLISEQGLTCDVIGGIATAGIPHAAWVAELLNKPMIYVRSAAKSHGKTRRIEGDLADGSHVVLIEDLVSTGQSSASAVAPIRDAACHVSAVLAVMTYGLPTAMASFKAVGTALYTLTDFAAVLQAAKLTGRISEKDQASLLAWHKSPKDWSERFVTERGDEQASGSVAPRDTE